MESVEDNSSPVKQDGFTELLFVVFVLMLASCVVQELELSFKIVSDHNVELKKNKGDLGAQLAARTAEKTALDRLILKLKSDANNTEQELKKRIVSVEDYKNHVCFCQVVVGIMSFCPLNVPEL